MKSLPRLRISPHTVIILIAFIIFDGSIISILPVIAALCHELGHIIVIYIVGAKIYDIEITLFGAEISSGNIGLSPMKNIAVYGAGGVANLFTAFWALTFFKSELALIFAVCSITLGILNFLPIRTLDGGCIVNEILTYCSPKYGDKIFSVISAIFLILLWFVSVFLLLVCGANASLLLFCVYMFANLYLT